MKESVKAARVHISLNALRILYAASEPLPMSEIFQYRGSSEVERSEATSPRARKWQAAVLGALERDGIVEETDDGYNVKDGQKLAAVLGNAEQDGTLISSYVFGRHQVELPVPAAADQGDGGGDIFLAMIDQISKNHATFDEGISSLLLNSNEIVDLLGKAADQRQQLNKSTNKRIDALEERVAGVQRVVEAMQTTAKVSVTALTELTSRLSNIGATADTLNATASALQEATAALKAASTLMVRAETDDLGKLLRGLKAHLDEGAALHESCLELLAERKS